MDNYIPSVIRDSRWFMYPFFWYWFKGKNISLFMNFKKEAYNLSEEEFTNCYTELDCRATDRPTDLNEKCIKKMLEKLPEGTYSLLDVGCGRGYWVKLLKEKTKLNITATDLFATLELPGITYVQAYIENLPFPDKSFDIVTCHHTIEHVRELDKVIAELKRVTRNQMIIVTPRQRYYYYTLDLHLHFFPQKEDLTELINLARFECFDYDGDWCYTGFIE